jgi:hypothetical protein
MPAKVTMQIGYFQKSLSSFKSYLEPKPSTLYQNLNPNQFKLNRALNSPMINRISNIRSGCSACGKKVM